MAMYFYSNTTDGTVNVELYTFINNYVGYNADLSKGSIAPTSYRGRPVHFVQWSEVDGLQIAFSSNGGNGGWGRLEVGSLAFLRTTANYTPWNGSVEIWTWPNASNPFPTFEPAAFPINIGYNDPDTNVNVSAPSSIGAGDDRFGVTVTGIDSPYTGRLYGIKLNGNDTSELTGTAPFATTTGANSSSVSFEVTSNLPPIGGSRTYYLYAARSGATGGAGGSNNEGSAAWIYAGRTFTVSRTNTPSALPFVSPLLEAYGLAIWDNTGSLLTSFSTEVMLNRVFTGTAILSTSSATTISGVPTSANNGNAIVTVEKTINAGTSPVPPARISSSGTVTIGRTLDNLQGARVSVMQWKDIPASGYGIHVKNGLQEGIINENTVSYGVTEVHTIDPSLTNILSNVIPGTQQSRYLNLTLTGNYPTSQTPPIVGIKSSHADWIIKPFLYSTNGTVFNRLYLQLPLEFTSGTVWTIALCVTSDVLNPQNYGATDYGIHVKNSSEVTTWSSSWKQAIISHVQNANVFSQGNYGNGAYDVEAGYDGVTAPASTDSEVYASLTSFGQSLNVSTRRLDPANTFICFNACQGHVRYNGGVKRLAEVVQYNAGGGVHYIAARVNSSSSASLSMFRITDFNPASTTDGIRIPNSNHPSGFITFLRIPGV